MNHTDYVLKKAEKINQNEFEAISFNSIERANLSSREKASPLCEVIAQGRLWVNGVRSVVRRERAFAEANLDLINKEFIKITAFDVCKELGVEYEEHNISSDLVKEAKRQTQVLRKAQKKEKSALEIKCGVIGGKYGGYDRATMRLINERKKKNKSIERFLNTHCAIGKNGEKVHLKDSAKRKLAEHAIVMQGIEKAAEDMGMEWMKAVVTLAGEYHPNPSFGKNNWNGMLPDESRAISQKQWTRVRSKLAKLGIILVGQWTVETNKDGTPHFNFLCYMPKGRENFVKQEFNSYMRNGNKAKCAIEFVSMDQYMYDGKCGFAKYAAKGIDPFLSNAIDANEEINKYALEEQVLASAFAWRRWGFFGIPPLSQWRALRRQNQCPSNATPLVKSMWRAARSGNFAQFIKLNGGLGANKKNRTIETVSMPSPSGDSKIVVGVREKATGYELITKQLGYFELIKMLPEIRLEQKGHQTTANLSALVTVKLTNLKENQNHHFEALMYAQMSGKSPPERQNIH